MVITNKGTTTVYIRSHHDIRGDGIPLLPGESINIRTPLVLDPWVWSEDGNHDVRIEE